MPLLLVTLTGCWLFATPPTLCTDGKEPSNWVVDADGDGYGTGVAQSTCGGTGYAQDSGDCDDSDPRVHPGATESCDLVADANCDGQQQNNPVDGEELYRDADGDGYGAEPVFGCPGEGFSTWSGDCDDTTPTISPEGVETCDGVDQDCDQIIDDSAIDVAEWYSDRDGDGHGDATSVIEDCNMPANASATGDDCDDTNIAMYPGALEVWYDGIDQDCDEANDYDQDGDGVDVNTDCDDTDASAYPGAIEIWYNGVDNACDGGDDYDQDLDGYIKDVDCVDIDADINPGVVDVWYDGIDRNCDGNDNDQDGDGSIYGVDCDDQDATSYLGATEIWYNGVDNACDGGNDYDQDGDGVDYPTDCSDTDPNTTGPSPESWDGVDNDCNGVVDDVPIATLKSGAVYGGTASLQLGQGDALSIGGDMTGDGVDDVAVGSDSVSSGYVYVVSGTTMLTACGVVGNYDVATITGSNTYYMMGLLSGPQQDLDGDGVADLISGGVYNSSYGYIWAYYDVTNSFSVYNSDVYFTSDGQNPDATQSFGTGDVDGDGILDIIFGGTIDNAGNVAVQSGVAYGQYRSSSADDEIHGTSSYNYLGKEVRVADWNSDGYEDFLVGAYGVDTGATDAGAVYLFEGNSNLSWSADADSASVLKISGTTASNAIGQDPLANPGDLNGDGSLDLVISAEGLGSVWFWWGGNLSGTTTVASANATFTGAAGDFGSALVYDTDFDGDGGLDLLIGSNGDDTSATNAGAVWFFGNTNWSGAYTSVNSNGVFLGESGDQLGTGLASGGDVNGDGHGDLLVGAAYDDLAATDGGVVYLVLGR